MSKIKSKIAFDFVLDYLDRLSPAVRPMFGCHSIYIGEKIMLITRQRDSHPEDNGIWIATSPEHHKSLLAEFPEMRSIQLLTLKGRTSNWQLIPFDSEKFEADAIKVCELILHGDERIGKIPKGRKKAGSSK